MASGLRPMTKRPQLPALADPSPNRCNSHPRLVIGEAPMPQADYGLGAQSRSARDLQTVPNHPTAERSPPPWKGGEREARGLVVFSGLTPDLRPLTPDSRTTGSPPRGRRRGPKRSDWWGGEAKILTPKEHRLPPQNSDPPTLHS